MKSLITCCGIVCAQGTPATWECPACHTVHVPEEGAAVDTPDVPPPHPLGAQTALLGGGLPGLPG